MLAARLTTAVYYVRLLQGGDAVVIDLRDWKVTCQTAAPDTLPLTGVAFQVSFVPELATTQL